MDRDNRAPEPAPGWRGEGYCYCGCGNQIPRPDQTRFFDRTHRSTRAPDGRLITEWQTKWCQTCQSRKAREDFPLKTKRTKAGYIQKPSFYCQACQKTSWEKLNEQNRTPEGRAKTATRVREAYQNPGVRADRIRRNKEYREQVRDDPERQDAQRAYRRKHWKKYRKRYSKMRRDRRRELRAARIRENENPLVIPRGHPMVEWLYQQIDRYCEERDLSGVKVFGPLMGKNWSRFRTGARSSGGTYMTLAMVDAVLVRLDLTHRLEDFPFQRRSDLKYDRLAAAKDQPDDQDDQQNQDDGSESNIHGPVPPLGRLV